MQPMSEDSQVCSNHEDCQGRRALIKLTKGFKAKETVKGRKATPFPQRPYYHSLSSSFNLRSIWINQDSTSDINWIAVFPKVEEELMRGILVCRWTCWKGWSYMKRSSPAPRYLNWLALWMNSALPDRGDNFQVFTSMVTFHPLWQPSAYYVGPY